MAKDAERALFASQILPAVGRDAARLPGGAVTGFLAMAGARYNGALMVVGRAVNGWTDGIPPHELSSREACERYADKVQKSVGGDGKCPMEWVSECWSDSQADYNTKRSAFWRAIHGVVLRLSIANIEDTAWPSHLVWSNLYKVSPAESGNPGDALCEAQLPGCIVRVNYEPYVFGSLLLNANMGFVYDGIPESPFQLAYASITSARDKEFGLFWSEDVLPHLDACGYNLDRAIATYTVIGQDNRRTLGSVWILGWKAKSGCRYGCSFLARNDGQWAWLLSPKA